MAAAFDGLEIVATRVLRNGRRWGAWCLCGHGGDASTDLWFWIRDTRTQKGAWNACAEFVRMNRQALIGGRAVTVRSECTMQMDGRVLARTVNNVTANERARG